MIVTVTPNTAIDRTLFLPTFGLNRTIRASRAVMGMGGKAADASWILGELGIPSLALGFAAGLAGRQMESKLRERGVKTDFIWTGGETRVNTLIVCEDGSGQSTIAVESLLVSQEDVQALNDRYREALAESTCVILGGSLPAGVEPQMYSQMILEARQREIPVVFDASGAMLRAGLEAGPTLVKPNLRELEEVMGKPVTTIEAAYEAAGRLYARYGTWVVLTMGEHGALAVLPETAYFIPPVPVPVASTAGAGDGVLAGLAAALSRKEPPEDGLRLGFAAASAVLLTPSTADCHREDIARLLLEVKLIPYHPGA